MSDLLQINEPGQPQQPAARPPAIGIDLGTTHSLVAVARNGKVDVFTDNDGRATVPSVLAYLDNDDVRVGRDAINLAGQGATLIRSIKRLMGRGLNDPEVQAYAKAHPNLTISGKAEMACIHAAGADRSAVELSSHILRYLKARAEEALGQEVYDAVITVPAYFNDAQRQATRDAARLAGLNVLRLLAEPTAAALAYGLDRDASGTFMIYDFGGGTFDVSILKLTQGVFRVIATGGDSHLGGDDIDSAIANHCGTDDLQVARAMKEALSASDTTTMDGCELTHTALIEIACPFINRTLDICCQTVQAADVAPRDLSGVVLVGGSTRMPAVVDALRAACTHEPVYGLNPDEVVVHGAAIQAEVLSGNCPGSTLLLDVTPLSLGLETMGALVEKIIPRNTPIPITRAQEFTTFKDNQTGMDIHVLQGERETVDGCRSLARFRLTGIPPLPAGAARIRVIFTLDADGLLTVRAAEKTTGVEQQVEVVPSYGLEEHEVLDILKASYDNAADDVAARRLREARLALERVADACAAALASDGDMLDADERARLEKLLQIQREALEANQPETVTAAAEALEDGFRSFAEARVNRAVHGKLKGRQVGEGA